MKRARRMTSLVPWVKSTSPHRGRRAVSPPSHGSWSSYARTATLLAVVAGVGAVQALGVSLEEMSGGWRWPALMFAAGESAQGAFGAEWPLGAARRHLDRPLRWVLALACSVRNGALSPTMKGLAVFTT